MIKELSRISFFLFLSLTLVMTSCDDDDDEEPPTPPPAEPTQNIAEIAQDNEQFSILVEALVATDLVATLEGDGPFTVFAPTNTAFNAFFDLEGLTDANGDGSRVDEAATTLGEQAIKDLLLYHVLEAEVEAADITAKDYQTTLSMDSPEGNALSLLIEPANNLVLLNGGADIGATVTTANILATNGIIHEIDAVLELPSVVDHVSANSNLSSLEGALVNADLVTDLETQGAISVLAPDNEAMAAATLPSDNAGLISLLQYHVLTEQVRSGQIDVDNPTPTLNGQSLDFDVLNETSVVITDSQGEISTVTLADIQGTNGVVHIINRVLLPQ
ncbi:MAG TPA: fasciclin domain-containing protein [Cryomorphaceae bacterium]|nr:fasciclin domain-containing protein [Cryomorphaceae bacterium]